MIYDSYVWKMELKKELRNFKRFISNNLTVREINDLTEDNFSDRASFSDELNIKLERFFFISAFIIRKLNEANKLSDELCSFNIKATKYNRIMLDEDFAILEDFGFEDLDFMNKHKFMDFYDFENGEKTFLNLKDLYNSLIHSFVFDIVWDDFDEENELISGIVVNTDYSKDSYLYYIKMKDYFRLLDEVIKDNIISVIHDKSLNIYKKSRNRIIHR